MLYRAASPQTSPSASSATKPTGTPKTSSQANSDKSKKTEKHTQQTTLRTTVQLVWNRTCIRGNVLLYMKHPKCKTTPRRNLYMQKKYTSNAMAPVPLVLMLHLLLRYLLDHCHSIKGRLSDGRETVSLEKNERNQGPSCASVFARPVLLPAHQQHGARPGMQIPNLTDCT